MFIQLMLKQGKRNMLKLRMGVLVVLFLFTAAYNGLSDANEERESREIDTFTSSGQAGKLDGWQSFDDDLDECYEIGQEENNFFLKARTKDRGSIIAKSCSYSLKEFPIITWRWRALLFPEGADERYKRSGDSVAGIYIIFPSIINPGNFANKLGFKLPVPDRLKPECIKYVWSASLPIGTVIDSPYATKTKIVVLQNATSPLNTWVTEEVNVYADYRRLFNKEPDEVKAVGILTDADDTSSEAMADYDDIFLKKSPVPQVNQDTEESSIVASNP
jgi:hypothetical protein